jgi:CheY-like chemotaxis protein
VTERAKSLAAGSGSGRSDLSSAGRTRSCGAGSSAGSRDAVARRWGSGAAIVRHITDLHGGTVVAESPGEGKGSTFTVELPRTISARTTDEGEHRPAAGAPAESRSHPSLEHVRVLVVDDEPDSNEMVSAIRGSCGAEVRVAGSGAEGLEELRRWTPDVVISDIGMPGEDCYAFVSKLRAHAGALGRIPAMALTAYATTEDRLRIFSAGFQAHVAKPVDAAELVAVTGSMARPARSSAAIDPRSHAVR